MRRNVRRLNREIGNHGSTMAAATQVSLPLALPTSYQPRTEEKKLVNNLKTVVNAQSSPDAQQMPTQESLFPANSVQTTSSLPTSSNASIPAQSLHSSPLNFSALTDHNSASKFDSKCNYFRLYLLRSLMLTRFSFVFYPQPHDFSRSRLT